MNHQMTSEQEEILKKIHYWALPRTPGSRLIRNEKWLQVISEDNKTHAHNEVIYSDLSENDFEQKLMETTQFYEALGTNFKWCTNPFTLPKKTPDLLKKSGFTSWYTTHMYLPVSDLQLTARSSDIDVRLIGQEEMQTFFNLFMKCWKVEPELVEKKKQQLSFDHQSKKASYERFIAFYRGQPAGVGSLARNRNAGYFHSTAVLPEFQGLGLYRALVEQRLKHLSDAGGRLAATVALPTSSPRLEYFGFKKAWTAEVFLKTF